MANSRPTFVDMDIVDGLISPLTTEEECPAYTDDLVYDYNTFYDNSFLYNIDMDDFSEFSTTNDLTHSSMNEYTTSLPYQHNPLTDVDASLSTPRTPNPLLKTAGKKPKYCPPGPSNLREEYAPATHAPKPKDPRKPSTTPAPEDLYAPATAGGPLRFPPYADASSPAAGKSDRDRDVHSPRRGSSRRNATATQPGPKTKSSPQRLRQPKAVKTTSHTLAKRQSQPPLQHTSRPEIPHFSLDDPFNTLSAPDVEAGNRVLARMRGFRTSHRLPPGTRPRKGGPRDEGRDGMMGWDGGLWTESSALEGVGDARSWVRVEVGGKGDGWSSGEVGGDNGRDAVGDEGDGEVEEIFPPAEGEGFLPAGSASSSSSSSSLASSGEREAHAYWCSRLRSLELADTSASEACVGGAAARGLGPEAWAARLAMQGRVLGRIALRKRELMVVGRERGWVGR
ncbi:hypothetical protein MBLNU230_g0997t1 [Neophaeotheca triangularis]